MKDKAKEVMENYIPITKEWLKSISKRQDSDLGLKAQTALYVMNKYQDVLDRVEEEEAIIDIIENDDTVKAYKEVGIICDWDKVAKRLTQFILGEK